MRIYREFIKSTESRESPEYSQFRVSRNFRKPRESRSFSRHSVIRWSIGGTLIDFYFFFSLDLILEVLKNMEILENLHNLGIEKLEKIIYRV